MHLPRMAHSKIALIPKRSSSVGLKVSSTLSHVVKTFSSIVVNGSRTRASTPAVEVVLTPMSCNKHVSTITTVLGLQLLYPRWHAPKHDFTICRCVVIKILTTCMCVVVKFLPTCRNYAKSNFGQLVIWSFMLPTTHHFFFFFFFFFEKIINEIRY